MRTGVSRRPGCEAPIFAFSHCRDVVVDDDGIYAAIGHIHDAIQDGRLYYTELRHPDLLGPALAGMPAWRVDRAGAFGETVARAITAPGPTLLDVDMSATGPVPSYGPYAKRRSP